MIYLFTMEVYHLCHYGATTLVGVRYLVLAALANIIMLFQEHTGISHIMYIEPLTTMISNEL